MDALPVQKDFKLIGSKLGVPHKCVSGVPRQHHSHPVYKQTAASTQDTAELATSQPTAATSRKTSSKSSVYYAVCTFVQRDSEWRFLINQQVGARPFNHQYLQVARTPQGLNPGPFGFESNTLTVRTV